MNQFINEKNIIIPGAIILITTMLYFLFRILVNVVYRTNFSKRRFGIFVRVNNDRITYRKRILAFLIYGMIPIFIIKYILHGKLQDYGFAMVHRNVKPIYFVIMAALAFPIMFLLSKKERINSHYPEVRGAFLSKWSLLFSSITYILYYFGYESLYRGFLVFGLKKYTGNFIAVIASMVFTSVTHLSSPWIVLIGSMVSGVIFPYIVILSGSIWALFVFHSIIGISMDIFCIKARRIENVEARWIDISISDNKLLNK